MLYFVRLKHWKHGEREQLLPFFIDLQNWLNEQLLNDWYIVYLKIMNKIKDDKQE